MVTIAVVDKYLRDYEEQTDKNATTYKAFYKVYVGAFRKTHTNSPIHDLSAEKANEIFEKIEMMKGNVIVAKMLKRRSWRYLLRNGFFIGKHVKEDTPEKAQQKSGILFTAIDTIMKSEKDVSRRKDLSDSLEK